MTKRLAVAAAVVLTTMLVAPAAILASHRFTDVPDTNTFHEEISALADAGVTHGCTTTQYCPDQTVSRQQMAGFLDRLGALSPDEDPVVNARAVMGNEIRTAIVPVDITNANNNNEECVARDTLFEQETGAIRPGSEYVEFFTVVEAPEVDSLGSWDINVNIADPTDDGFLLCVSMIDVSDVLPEGRYVFHQMEAVFPAV